MDYQSLKLELAKMAICICSLSMFNLILNNISVMSSYIESKR